MKFLALDTSSLACSAALQLDDARTERYEEQAREHTRLIMPMIRSLLDESGIALADLDAIVLGNGPGSFIGMRIGASVAQGLAYGAGLRIVPVSSMAAVASAVLDTTDADEVVVAQDAHMNEVYLGVYMRDAAGLPAPSAPERLHRLREIGELDAAESGRRVAAGQGWHRYPELMVANRDRIGGLADERYPRASHLLSLGAAAFGAGEALDPRDIDPAYLRHKVASESPSAP